MGNCFWNRGCKGIQTYTSQYNDCEIYYTHSHCRGIIPHTLTFCNAPIFWWEFECSNPECSSNV